LIIRDIEDRYCGRRREEVGECGEQALMALALRLDILLPLERL
jgi:hypothetical protein